MISKTEFDEQWKKTSDLIEIHSLTDCSAKYQLSNFSSVLWRYTATIPIPLQSWYAIQSELSEYSVLFFGWLKMSSCSLLLTEIFFDIIFFFYVCVCVVYKVLMEFFYMFVFVYGIWKLNYVWSLRTQEIILIGLLLWISQQQKKKTLCTET